MATPEWLSFRVLLASLGATWASSLSSTNMGLNGSVYTIWSWVIFVLAIRLSIGCLVVQFIASMCTLCIFPPALGNFQVGSCLERLVAIMCAFHPHWGWFRLEPGYVGLKQHPRHLRNAKAALRPFISFGKPWLCIGDIYEQRPPRITGGITNRITGGSFQGPLPGHEVSRSEPPTSALADVIVEDLTKSLANSQFVTWSRHRFWIGLVCVPVLSVCVCVCVCFE